MIPKNAINTETEITSQNPLINHWINPIIKTITVHFFNDLFLANNVNTIVIINTIENVCFSSTISKLINIMIN